MERARTVFLLLNIILLLCSNALSAGDPRDKLGIGFSVTTQKLFGDTRDGRFVFGGNPILIRYDIKRHAYLETDVGFAQLTTKFGGRVLNTDMIHMGLKVAYRFLNDRKVNPIVYVGFGVLNFRQGGSPRYWDGYGTVGGGAEWFLAERIGLNLTGDVRYTSGDDFDGSRGGGHRDAYLNFGLGLSYYLGQRGRVFAQAETSEPTPEERVALEEVLPAYDVVDQAHVGADSLSTEEQQALEMEKEVIVHSLAQRDRTIRLLKAKLKILDRQRDHLDAALAASSSSASNGLSANRDERKDQLKKRFQAALDYFAVGQYEDAILSLRSILNESPHEALSGSCWYWLGESYYSTHEFDKAISAFEQASRQTHTDSPRSQMSQVMLGLSRWKYGAITQARMDFQDMLRNNLDGDLLPLVSEYLGELRLDGIMNSTN